MTPVVDHCWDEYYMAICVILTGAGIGIAFIVAIILDVINIIKRKVNPDILDADNLAR